MGGPQHFSTRNAQRYVPGAQSHYPSGKKTARSYRQVGEASSGWARSRCRFWLWQGSLTSVSAGTSCFIGGWNSQCTIGYRVCGSQPADGEVRRSHPVIKRFMTTVNPSYIQDGVQQTPPRQGGSSTIALVATGITKTGADSSLTTTLRFAWAH